VDELGPLVTALVATLSGGAITAISGMLARRSARPSEADIAITQDELSEALEAATEPEPIVEPSALPTSSGKDEALVLVSVYMRDVVTEAGRIAKRLGAERASDVHIRQAAARIGIMRSRAGAVADISLALGSLLVGGAVSYQVNLWTGGEPASGAGLYAICAFGLGVGTLVAGGMAKWLRR
jgi:hypothetical protein